MDEATEVSRSATKGPGPSTMKQSPNRGFNHE